MSVEWVMYPSGEWVRCTFSGGECPSSNRKTENQTKAHRLRHSNAGPNTGARCAGNYAARGRTARIFAPRTRAALEAVGLVHEHNFGHENKGYTPIKIWLKKAALRPLVVAPISMAATPGAFAVCQIQSKLKAAISLVFEA